MKIFVTGALGHIGSRLIRELPLTFPGARITMLDDLSTQRYASLFNLPETASYQFLQADLLKADLPALLRGHDAAIHLAAITDAPSSFDRPELVEKVNLDGTRLLADACSAAGVPLVFPSTTSVYGTQKQVVDEDCPPEELKPQSPYAESKLAAERMLQERAQAGTLRSSILRLGTIFGTSPGMRFHTAVNKFCWQAVLGQPLTVWRAALNQDRPYLDLGDAVRAIAFVLQKHHFDGRVYNVLTTNTAVKSIVDLLAKQFPDLRVEHVDTKIMNQLSYHVSSAKFRNLGFEFQGSLERGVEETVRLLRRMRS